MMHEAVIVETFCRRVLSRDFPRGKSAARFRSPIDIAQRADVLVFQILEADGALPPVPITAMFSLSLGGVAPPRPSTRAGKKEKLPTVVRCDEHISPCDLFHT
jgi:hypothetical protein